MSGFFLTALLTIQQEHHYYLPNRNFLPFNGKPMYEHMIQKLLAVTQFESIVIITDSDEVKEYCKWNGRLRVFDLPYSLTGENIPSDRITTYILEKVSGEHFIEFQSFNPLVTQFTLEAFIKHYIDYVVPGEYFDSLFSMQRHELRNYDLNKRKLNTEFLFTIFENKILQGFNRTTFKKCGNKKFGQMAMMYDIREVENTLLDSDTNYELAKLVFENRDKFPAIFHSGI